MQLLMCGNLDNENPELKRVKLVRLQWQHDSERKIEWRRCLITKETIRHTDTFDSAVSEIKKKIMWHTKHYLDVNEMKATFHYIKKRKPILNAIARWSSAISE